MLLIEMCFCLTVFETTGLQCRFGISMANEFGRGRPIRISVHKQVNILLDSSLYLKNFIKIFGFF
jgi:hypothetical protein